MATLAELNQRAWYRLLKVVYVVLFLIPALTVVAIVFSAKKPERLVDYERTTISCVSDWVDVTPDEYGFVPDPPKGPERITFTAAEAKVMFDSLSGRVTLESKYRIRDRCGNDNYKIKMTYIDKSSWAECIGYSAITLVVIAALFELLRRVFYYVALGSFRPSS